MVNDQRTHHIQRALEGTGTSEDEVPDTVLDVLGDGGQSLEQPIQRALEERMDADFSNVRIHTGAKAAEAADAIDAKAFTCGNDIVFNSGEYDPESGEGQFLLAHELAHVKQQTGAAISMMPQEGADLEIDPDPHLEREADETAQQALSGDKPLVVNPMGADMHIQRSTKGPQMSRRELVTLGNPEKGTPSSSTDQGGKIKQFLDDFSTVKVRLSVDELKSLVTSVDTVDDMYSYLAERDIEPSSDLEEWINSPLLRGYRSAGATSSVFGLLALGFTPQAVAALSVGVSVAAVLRKYGDEIGDEARKWLRKRLDETEETIVEEESGTGSSTGDAQSRR
ncbi:DUF4157 domain-containing protein [Natronolimnobius sp. AArcel1]|uniref:eCIS core domain-containing protein n=1 Tax=Natronolimnobius sp. AArcel1 TaxID=1679093 RepID=UPI0013EA7622|nr:DUF4157 domain-containing protein [Natronolimnobius sp. AArcel1]NGM70119.1 DUF4157 domain-containing protein [Natronolimnobius sp. AArcel1]